MHRRGHSIAREGRTSSVNIRGAFFLDALIGRCSWVTPPPPPPRGKADDSSGCAIFFSPPPPPRGNAVSSSSSVLGRLPMVGGWVVGTTHRRVNQSAAPRWCHRPAAKVADTRKKPTVKKLDISTGAGSGFFLAI